MTDNCNNPAPSASRPAESGKTNTKDAAVKMRNAAPPKTGRPSGDPSTLTGCAPMASQAHEGEHGPTVPPPGVASGGVRGMVLHVRQGEPMTDYTDNEPWWSLYEEASGKGLYLPACVPCFGTGAATTEDATCQECGGFGVTLEPGRTAAEAVRAVIGRVGRKVRFSRAPEGWTLRVLRDDGSLRWEGRGDDRCVLALQLWLATFGEGLPPPR